MPIKELCQKRVITVAPEATIREAALKMKESHVGDLVVVKSANGGSLKPVGILTDRDIVRFVVSAGTPPDDVKVEDIMARSLRTAKESDGVYETITLMRENVVRRLPVVDNSGNLVGIIALDDLTRLLGMELQRLSEVSAQQPVKESNSAALSARFQSNETKRELS